MTTSKLPLIIPSPREIRAKIEARLSEEGYTLLSRCITAINSSTDLAEIIRVQIPEGTPRAAIDHVVATLRKQEWGATHWTGSQRNRANEIQITHPERS